MYLNVTYLALLKFSQFIPLDKIRDSKNRNLP